MKQLYIIGIAVAVILMLFVGLSKLSKPATLETDKEPAADTFTQDGATATPETTTMSEETLPTESSTEPTPNATMNNEDTTVVMHTNKGDITIELYTKDAPITAGNYLKLIEQGFYDGVKFHRVIDGFMIQGGDPLSKDDSMQVRWGTGGPGYAIQDEFAPGLSNVRGTLAMANSGPNTGGSQFFINTVDNTYLDHKHAVFGRVTAGMEVVDAISKVETGPGDRPVDPVVIKDIMVQ